MFLDAEVTLRRLMRDGVPDPQLFQALVGEVLPGVRNRAVQSGVRAYGQMVGLQWKAGAHEAAAQLERLNSGLEEALDRAMHEVLGPRLEQLRELMRANHRPAWAKFSAGGSVGAVAAEQSAGHRRPDCGSGTRVLHASFVVLLPLSLSGRDLLNPK